MTATTRKTASDRADACKHVMSLVGVQPDDPIIIILEVNGVLSAGLGFLTRADKATVSRMTAAVTEAKGSEAAEEKTLFVTPLNTLQLDMVTKFYQHVQLTKTTTLADADVMKLTEDDYVVFHCGFRRRKSTCRGARQRLRCRASSRLASNWRNQEDW